MLKYLYPFVTISLLLAACTKKDEPIVTTSKTLKTPIKCIKLNSIGLEEKFKQTLVEMYDFDDSCELSLTLSYKRNIVCNSSGSATLRTVGSFPKSFLKLELRDGLEVEYSYYVDLYSNVDIDDLKSGFDRLKDDLLKKNVSD